MDTGKGLLFESFQNAPLIYTLGLMHFPRLPPSALDRVIDAFHERVREKGYPAREDIQAPSVRADFDREGFRVTQRESALHQFGTADRTWAFILSDEMLALHTNTHEDHLQFVNRFVFGAEVLASIDHASIDYVESVGVRYVNLVAPRERETLHEYLRSWALPLDEPTLYDGTRFQIRESMYVISCRSGVGDLRYQALRNPRITIPPELASPLVRGNGWTKPRPEGEFALVDLEHGCQFDPLKRFHLQELSDCMEGLCRFVAEWFLGAATDHAINVWRGK
jgi:uncharacterized protein (TIGR04255 family)